MSDPRMALITGANKGIGYAIAAGLGELGWRVGVGARDEERRTTAVTKLRNTGVDAFPVPLDVTDRASVAAAVDLIGGRAGRLDALVNNAGITGGGPQAPTTVTPEIMSRVVATNVTGVIRVTNAMLPLLRPADSPRIVNVSSSVGSLALRTGGGEVGPIAESRRCRPTGPAPGSSAHALRCAAPTRAWHAGRASLYRLPLPGLSGPRTSRNSQDPGRARHLCPVHEDRGQLS